MYNAITDFIRYSPDPAIYYRDRVLSYTDVLTGVARYANSLSQTLLAGDRIMISMMDCPEWIFTFWGAIKIGVIPHIVNPGLTDAQRDLLYRESGARLLITESTVTLIDALATDGTDRDPIMVDSDDPCFVLYTSGTTGYMKGIVHRHGDLIRTCQSYADSVLRLSRSDVCLSAAKLFFAYGLGNSMSFPFHAGASVVLIPEKTTVKVMFDAIDTYRPTVYFGVPTLYAHQAMALAQDQHDLSSVRMFVSAGEALPGKILSNWIGQTGKPILDGIGTTEMLHIFISNTPSDVVENCSGRVLTGYEATIVDGVGNAVQDGTMGYLRVRALGHDWMETGDVFIHLDGLYYYQGRANDMLKVSGLWVSPTEIERAVVAHPGVLEAAVVDRVGPTGLTQLTAFVVKKDHGVTAAQLRRWCQKELTREKIPQRIEFVEQLPKTTTGKIQRFKLRQMSSQEP